MSPAMPSSRSRRSASTSSPSRIRSPALSWVTRSIRLSHSGVAYSGWLPTSRYSRAPLRRKTLLLRPHETTRRNRYLATSSGDKRRCPRNVQVTPYSFSSPKIRLSIRSQLPVHGDVLGLGVLQQTFVRALATQARLLHAAERRGRVGDDAAVDADHARLQRLRDPQRAPQVAAVQVRHQPVLGVVRHRDRLVLVGEPDDGCDRSENLLAEDAGPGRDAVEHGRLVVIPDPVRGVSAGQYLGAVASSR